MLMTVNTGVFQSYVELIQHVSYLIFAQIQVYKYLSLVIIIIILSSLSPVEFFCVGTAATATTTTATTTTILKSQRFNF